MIDPVLCQRIEESHPVDRVRGTVVNVTPSGIFVVKYDNGDYLAYQPEQKAEFTPIPDKPIPNHAVELIHRLRKKHGTTPPEDVMALRGKLPSQQAGTPDGVGSLTSPDGPPSMGA